MKYYETDWLNTKPIFYNEKTKKVSYNINDVIDYADLEFDSEGLGNYLDFGYSVLGHTPVKGVKFLRWSSVITVEDGRYTNIEQKPDPAERYIERQVSEEEIWDLIHEEVNSGISTDGVIIPTSGGYDSRILNYMYDKKDNILSYSYGISPIQSESSEVVYARALCKKLGVKWDRIPLRDFNSRIGDWINLYGCSTHSHGMYHMEFYEKIANKLGHDVNNYTLLSGIIGDAWAGTVDYQENINETNFNKLGYTHGLHADSEYCLLKSNHEIVADYLERNKYRLKTAFGQVLASMRMKMILLSYLLNIPAHSGFKQVKAPYLNIDIALGMLNLPPNRRADRLWQKEFFIKNGLDVENWGLFADYRNGLDIYAMQAVTPKPLDISVLRELFDEGYLRWINKNYCTSDIKAMSCYYTLYPLEVLLKKRNAYYHDDTKNFGYASARVIKEQIKQQLVEKVSGDVYIGADFIPTSTNKGLFNAGDIETLIGTEIYQMLCHSELNVFNLEMPLTNKGTPILKSGPNLCGDTAAIKTYKKIRHLLLTLANNHILDYGEAGIKNTIELLNAANINHIGGGMNLREAHNFFPIKLSNGVSVSFYGVAEHECTIATHSSAGANPFDPLVSYDAVELLKKKYDYVVVLYHGGREEYRYPSPMLQRYLRKFIDKGADLVVAQHSHCIGCRENYNDGVIIYGQGNFLFNLDHSDEFFDTGLLLECSFGEKMIVKEIPIKRNGCGVRMAKGAEAEAILGGYCRRGHEIKAPGFVEENYKCFVADNIKRYLEFFWPGAFNHFYNNMLPENYVHILNNIRCEAHNELIQEGLRILIGRGRYNG